MSSKILVAFDFDHTVVDENSDIFVRNLAPDGVIPEALEKTYSDGDWTKFMARIFKYLHENGISAADMINYMKAMPLVEGFHELFQYLSNDKFHTIIISDSNSVFIDCIIKEAGLTNVIDRVYTNPASFDAWGCLNVDYYHTQDWCDLSAKNLCKGHVLEEHISDQSEQGVTYSTVLYVGDGSNDYCPALKLRDCDYLLPRQQFKLEKIVKKNRDKLKCHVVVWEKGSDIIGLLKTL